MTFTPTFLNQRWYSFAAVAAAANRPDDALQHLHEAVNRGYKDSTAAWPTTI